MDLTANDREPDRHVTTSSAETCSSYAKDGSINYRYWCYMDCLLYDLSATVLTYIPDSIGRI